MADFIPPKPWHDSLVRSALFVAERKFSSAEPEDPGQDDELLAHRARVFVEAINRMPVEQQPANWIVADDPNAKAEWLNDKLNFMAGFNRELDEENAALRRDNKQLRRDAEAHRDLAKMVEKQAKALVAMKEHLDSVVAEYQKAKAKLHAAGTCKAWTDDLGRKFVFCDELYHALEPELWPEPKPVRIDDEVAD